MLTNLKQRRAGPDGRPSSKIIATAVAALMLAAVCAAVLGGPDCSEAADAQPATKGDCGESTAWAFDTKTGELNITLQPSKQSGKIKDFLESETRWGGNDVRSVEIAKGVTSIGKNAFLNCRSLTSVTIPGSVTSVGDYAFCGCVSLAVPELPEKVTKGWCAFCGCKSGAPTAFAPTDEIEGDCGDGLQWSVDKAGKLTVSLKKERKDGKMKDFGETEKRWGGNDVRSVEIAKGVTSIGENAFLNCGSLKSVSLPSTLTSIGKNAFCGCTSLESVDIPGDVKSLPDCAFCGCTSLKHVSIPKSVTSVGDHVFSGCTFLNADGRTGLSGQEIAGHVFEGTDGKLVKKADGKPKGLPTEYIVVAVAVLIIAAGALFFLWKRRA